MKREWKAADTETYLLMLKASNREKGGDLDITSIKNFPCEVLSKIDRLWVASSGGKFGFSVQKKIYVESCGGKPDGQNDKKALDCFGDRVGWSEKGQWLFSITYNILMLVELEILVEVMIVTIRETAISKLHQLPEVLVQEVSDFIDFVIHKHQAKPDINQPAETIAERWSQWFKAVDCLDVTPPEPVSNYQQLLIEKYRQQGLKL